MVTQAGEHFGAALHGTLEGGVGVADDREAEFTQARAGSIGVLPPSTMLASLGVPGAVAPAARGSSSSRSPR